MTNYQHPTQTTAIWRVFVEVGAKFQPCSIVWYASTDYRDAFTYLETRLHLVNKKRKIYVRQLMTDFKHYHFDEGFYAALQIGQDVTSDEFYEEKTDEDKTFVQIHQPAKPFKIVRAVWHGAKRHSRF